MKSLPNSNKWTLNVNESLSKQIRANRELETLPDNLEECIQGGVADFEAHMLQVEIEAMIVYSHNKNSEIKWCDEDGRKTLKMAF